MSKLYKLQLRHGSDSLSEGPGVVEKKFRERRGISQSRKSCKLFQCWRPPLRSECRGRKSITTFHAGLLLRPFDPNELDEDQLTLAVDLSYNLREFYDEEPILTSQSPWQQNRIETVYYDHLQQLRSPSHLFGLNVRPRSLLGQSFVRLGERERSAKKGQKRRELTAIPDLKISEITG